MSFHGIGPGPRNKGFLGCCSQMAMFVRRDFWTATNVNPPNFEPAPIPMISDTIDLESTDSLIDEMRKVFVFAAGNTKPQKSCEDNAMCKVEIRSPLINSCLLTHLIEYKHIKSITYPMYKDDRTFEEKLLHEAKYYINRCLNMDEEYFNYDEYLYRIPLLEIHQSIIELQHTIDELR